ncbi:hypothetical protein PTKIN_Ptkin15bG0142500 [Pterospermum kingtungense]
MNLLYILLLSLFLSSCRSADPLGNYCNENTKIRRSQTSANIGSLLAEVVSKTSSTGYIATSSGKGPDKVYGLAQCRGDVSSKDCSSCIQDAAKQIRERCPNQADARIWYDYCFLRYSQENFVGKVDTSYGIYYFNVENVTDPQRFNKELGALMDKIRSEAVIPKNGGLGKGKTKLSPFITLYALVQCTRDLSPIDCAQCLAIAVGNFPNFCQDRKGCRVLYSSCYVRCRSADPLGNYCDENTNIGGSQTSVNIDNLLAEVVSNISLTAYIATSSGEGADEVYGLAQCRGDVSSKDCSSCIQDAAKEIRKRCPNQADARIWYDYCFLRYSQENFAGEVDTSFGIFYFNVENVTDPPSFNRELEALMDNIRSEAVMPKNEGLGKGKTKLSPYITLYALVQCTRDLSPIDCAQCLAIAVGNFPNFCRDRKGCRALYSSCYVRYELYPFFFPLDSNNGTSFGKTVMIIVHHP